MILTIHIKNKQERIEFAREVRNLLGESQTYIPNANADIGVRANTDKATYQKILALIERRGYKITK